MLHVIKKVFPNENESRINTGLMNREYEKELQHYVVQSFKSIEAVLDNVHMTDYEFTDDPDDIDLSTYEQTRKSNQVKGIKKIAYIKQSIYGQLTMTFLVELPEKIRDAIACDEGLKKSKRYGQYIRPDYNLEFVVRLLIPEVDETGRYVLNGTKTNRLYQLTEMSTYITPGCNVTKAVMAIMAKRNKYTAVAVSGQEYVMNQFKIIVFKGFMNIFILFFATMGVRETLDFFKVSECIQFININDGMTPNYEYFQITTDGLAIRTDKRILGIKYIQGMIGTIISAVSSNKYTTNEFFDKNTWIKRMGITKKKVNDEVMLDLGKKNLTLFFRMYSDTIKEGLRLREMNKKHVYAIIRWMVQHYDEIRLKDNLDFKNKKLRGNEQYAALLDEYLSAKMKTLVSHDDEGRAENVIDKYRRFFNYRGRELISKMHEAQLISNDGSVNDMDMFNKLKYTKKGPNSLGNKSSRNIAAVHRALHVSEIGIDSLCTCSASEPGLTNFINPLCETDGLYFKGANKEPENFYYDFINELRAAVGEPPLGNNTMYKITDPSKYGNLFEIEDVDI